MKTSFVKLLCLFVLIIQLPAFALSNPAEVNEKLIRAFRNAFPQAEKVIWQETEDHYVVHFTENTVLLEIEYDHDGNLLRSIRYFKDPDLLPIHLSWKLHKKFPDKTIFAVTEMTSEEETLYYIKLEDNKSWMTVKATPYGSMEITEKYLKQQ